MRYRRALEKVNRVVSRLRMEERPIGWY